MSKNDTDQSEGRAETPGLSAATVAAPGSEWSSRESGLIESLVDNTPDIIFYKDLNGNYLGCNSRFAELVGRPRSEIIGRTDFDLFARGIAEAFRDNDRKMLDSGVPHRNEEWINYPDGRKILVDTLKTPYRSPDGILIGVLGISRDCTARKQGEDALREANHRLSLAVRAGGVGIWDWDVVNNRLEWDGQMFRLYGITRDQFSGAYEAWQAGLHPDDRDRGNEEIQLALQGKKEFDIEFRVVRPDGTIRDIRGFGFVERDADGRTLRMVGTNWDITDQKRAEEALRESDENFRNFFETITDMILVGTPDGRILFANSAVTRLLGYTQDEIKGMHLLDLHPADTREEANAIFAAMFLGERASCPLPLARKDGTLMAADTRVWVGRWDGMDCVFGLCKNLTEELEAKQRFERLFRGSPNAVAVSSMPEHRFVDVNDAFLQTLGYSRDELIGKVSTDLGLFVDPDRHAAAGAELTANGRLADWELQVRRKDGGIIDGIFSGEMISIQGQQFLLTVMVNITARKRAESELERLAVIQHELMHLATHFVNVPTGRQDAAIDESLAIMGHLIDADRAYLFTYDFDAGTMSNTHEWCGPGISPEIDHLQAVPNDMVPDWVTAHQRGEVVHIPSVAALPEDLFLRQVLEPQGIRSLVTLPLMQGDACLGFVGFDAVREERVWRREEVDLLRVLAEIYANFETRRASERHADELRQSLIEARDEAQAAAHAKSLFLGNMSHEIRTPLNAILGYAQIMQRECAACPSGSRLGAITRSGEHLLELLTDLLELVRNDAQSVTLAPCDFDFHQVLVDVRLMFARRPELQHLALEFTHAPDVPRFISADSGKVRQVVLNLVGNAIKFTEEGSVRVSASVVSDSGADDLLLAVDIEDTGCGVGAEELERIFDVFEQAQQGRKGSGGAGLGLALSRRYARAMGGDVTVTSRVGEGSRFRFTFNARIVSSGGEQPVLDNVLRLAPGQPACRVLVVDDEAENRGMLGDMLEPVGFTVLAADSAARALDLLDWEHGIDLVLMDKRMPGMDGYAAINHLRSLVGGCKLPVVVVTAFEQADEKEQARVFGADAYVSKPVRREELLAVIGRLTGVRYEYDKPLPAAVPAAMPLTEVHAAAVCLSKEQRQRLDRVMRRGDIRALRELIAVVAEDNEALSARMSALADVYDYDRLRELLGIEEGAVI